MLAVFVQQPLYDLLHQFGLDEQRALRKLAIDNPGVERLKSKNLASILCVVSPPYCTKLISLVLPSIRQATPAPFGMAS
jgi:hypothetical protein